MPFPADDPRGWLREWRELTARHPSVTLVTKAPCPVIEGRLTAGGRDRWLRLVWPAEYPLRPPSVWEITGRGGEVIAHRETGHGYADGSICLFVHNAGRGWSTGMTAADALDKLREFFDAQERGELATDRRFAWETDVVRVSLPKALARALRGGGRWGVVRGLKRVDGRMWLVTFADGVNEGVLCTIGASAPASAGWVTAGGFAPGGVAQEWSGLWCRVGETGGRPPATRDEVQTLVRETLSTPGEREFLAKARALLVVQADALWLVHLDPQEPLKTYLERARVSLLLTRVVEEDLSERLFLRVDGRLSSVTQLRRARVALAGVGSLGSHVAVSLAKSGVGRFVLYDPELLEPENVPRHVGTVDGIGLPKVEVVRDAILRVNPDADVVVHRVGISLDPAVWHLDPGRHFHEVLDDPCGMVVCTTATDLVERAVNEACVRKGCPAVFGAVLGRADHGRVFRVMPGETACYVCVLLRQHENPGRHPRFDEEGRGAAAYAQPGIPGLGMDVEQVGLLVARMALQTLGRRIDGGIGYPDSHGDHLIWSNRGGWAVDGPLQTRVEDVHRHPECSVCGEPRAAPLTEDEARELRAIEGAQ